MAKTEWWEKGQHAERFNRVRDAKQQTQSDANRREDGQGRPPTHGLHGGPTPPGNVRAEADRAARLQAEKDRKLAQEKQKDDNNKGR